MNGIIPVLVLMFLLAYGCGGNERVMSRLDDIDRLCDSDPRLAMSMLDSIDYSTLTERERHRYDLLDIKSRDKAYVRHTSDSLVLDVIDYYTSHQDEGLGHVALYYGGRVYFDLGDLPTALEYFQKAIDTTPNDDGNLEFKSNILSQKGLLLYLLRAHDEARKSLKQSIEIKTQIGGRKEDIAYEHNLTGLSYLATKDHDSARIHITKALMDAEHLNPNAQLDTKIGLTELLSYENKYDSALQIIRPLIMSADSAYQTYVLASASQLYCAAGIADTAYMYARKLSQSKDKYNKKIGFKVIFSQKLRNYVPKDTLLALIQAYNGTIEEYLKANDQKTVLIQNSRYNYDVHVREKERADMRLKDAITIAVSAIAILLIVIVVLLTKKYAKAKRKSDYLEVINFTDRIKKEQTIIESDTKEDQDIYSNTDILTEIKGRILTAIQSNWDKTPDLLIKPEIKESPLYKELSEMVTKKKCITDDGDIDCRLRELIDRSSPDFIKRLTIITEGKISPSELKIALLIRCGFKPVEIGILLSRQRNTISTQRKSLANKISTMDTSLRMLDLTIMSL